MIHQNIFPDQTRTYATYANAVKRAERADGYDHGRYLIAATPDGRFFPVYIGTFDLIHQGFAIAG